MGLPLTADDTAPRLELLTTAHGERVLHFERVNRKFFADRIGDRGDDYFEQFADLLAARVAENDAGTSLYFVVVDVSGQVLGRINISDIDQVERTELGFRLAETAQGHGVATRGVMAALEVARERGVRSIGARVAIGNARSHGVLERCGFTRTGPAAAPAGSAKTFLGYRLEL